MLCFGINMISAELLIGFVDSWNLINYRISSWSLILKSTLNQKSCVSISRKKGKQQKLENDHTIWRNVCSSIPVPPSFPHCVPIFEPDDYFHFLLTSWTSRKEADEQIQWAQGKLYKVLWEFFFPMLVYLSQFLIFCSLLTGGRKAWCLHGEAPEEECFQRSSVHAVPTERRWCIM